jgi:DNA-binding NarL/FixJ family response regulator
MRNFEQDPWGAVLSTDAGVTDDDLRNDGTSDPARVRVTIGDPDVFSQRAVTRVLDQDGRFEVCATARDAAETIAAVVDAVPDICLLEVAMPGGGLAAAWEIKARLPEAHVVMFTSRESEEELLEALEIGVSGYLLKAAVLSWLPNALMDVYRGTFALPRRLTGPIVRQLQRTEPRRRTIIGTNARLTSREWEVLNLIAGGLSTRQVAEKLTVSPTAIRVHIAAVVRKLGVDSRAEAIELFTRVEDRADNSLRLA